MGDVWAYRGCNTLVRLFVPAEIPMLTRFSTLAPGLSVDSSTANIGIPLDTVSCFVVRVQEDDKPFIFELVPVGNVGELVVGGHQLASGYINRPEQTTKVFIDSE